MCAESQINAGKGFVSQSSLRRSFLKFITKKWYAFFISIVIFGGLSFVLKSKLPAPMQAYYMHIRPNLDEIKSPLGYIALDQTSQLPIWTQKNLFNSNLIAAYINATSTLDEAIEKCNGMVTYTKNDLLSSKSIYTKRPFNVFFKNANKKLNCSFDAVVSEDGIDASNFVETIEKKKYKNKESLHIPFNKEVYTPVGKILVTPYKGNKKIGKIRVTHTPLSSITIPLDATLEVYNNDGVINLNIESEKDPAYVIGILNSLLNVVSEKITNNSRAAIKQSLTQAEKALEKETNPKTKEYLMEVKEKLRIDLEGIQNEKPIIVIDRPRMAAKVFDPKPHITYILLIIGLLIPLIYYYYQLVGRHKLLVPQEAVNRLNSDYMGLIESKKSAKHLYSLDRSIVSLKQTIEKTGHYKWCVAPISSINSGLIEQIKEALEKRGQKTMVISGEQLSDDKLQQQINDNASKKILSIIYFESPLKNNELLAKVQSDDAILWIARTYIDKLDQMSEIAQLFSNHNGLQSVLVTF